MSLTNNNVKTIQFSGSNFPVWKTKMKSLFTTQGLYDVVCNGVQVKQDDGEEEKKRFDTETRMSQKAHSMLVMAMPDSQFHMSRTWMMEMEPQLGNPS